jgi:hypothetical protein
MVCAKEGFVAKAVTVSAQRGACVYARYNAQE